jgi:hypothetical protein
MREDTGMSPAGSEARPLVPPTRWRRIVRALRAILRPRLAVLSWGAGRVAAGAVLAAGVIAQALFGWRWWVVVIVLTVAGEAMLVASALARSAEREELVDELVAALAPHRQARRRTRRALERFRAARSPSTGWRRAGPGPGSSPAGPPAATATRAVSAPPACSSATVTHSPAAARSC